MERSLPLYEVRLVHAEWVAGQSSLGCRWARLIGAGDVVEEGRQALTDGTALLSIPTGSYIAGLTDAGRVGEFVTFEVVDAPLMVELPDWVMFPVSFRTQDAYSGDAIVGVKVTLRRVGSGAGLGEGAVLEAVSDDMGMIRVGGLVPSEWRIVTERDGYVSEDMTLDLPGGWSDGLKKHGVVDLRWIPIAPITTVTFKLVGGDAYESLAQYSIAHTHEGERAYFDAEGRVDLVLGWFDEPLYVKLWYPDDRAAVMYLDDGLPPDGGVHEIEIGGARQLEVDLRFAASVTDRIAAAESGGLRVSFRPASGDAKFVGVDTKSEGSYVFKDVQADVAVVNFATASGGQLPVDWKTVWVHLKPTGITRCSLVVDQAPLSFVFRGNDGEPVGGYAFELRQLPDTTSWIAGGVSDDQGIAPAVRVDGRSCALYGTLAGTARTMAIDLPLDMSGAGEVLEVLLGRREPTYLDVTVAGRLRSGVSFSLLGRDTGVRFKEVTSGESGGTEPVDLVIGSRVDAVLMGEELWTPRLRLELQPGRNAIELYDMGFLLVRDITQLGRVVHDSLSASLGLWIEQGLLSTQDQQGAGLAVPAGRYTVDAGTDVERHIVVLPAESLDSGL